MNASYQEFDQHVENCNTDFKENILKMVQMTQIKDTDMLNKRVEELKEAEQTELQ